MALVAAGSDLTARKEAGVGKRQPLEEEGTKIRIEKEDGFIRWGLMSPWISGDIHQLNLLWLLSTRVISAI